jgi:hypothetical protein
MQYSRLGLGCEMITSRTTWANALRHVLFLWVFNCVVNIWNCLASIEKVFDGCKLERMWIKSWHMYRHYSGICMEGLRKPCSGYSMSRMRSELDTSPKKAWNITVQLFYLCCEILYRDSCLDGLFNWTWILLALWWHNRNELSGYWKARDVVTVGWIVSLWMSVSC